MKMQFEPGDLNGTLTKTFRFPMNDCYVLDVKATTIRVDRKEVHGWIFGLNQVKLAMRLLACIRAGKAFDSYEIKTDVNGATYISADTTGFFHKQHMSKELAKLGF